MKRAPQISRAWKVYLEIVHNTLFFEILFHIEPNGFVHVIQGAIKAVQDNGSIVALVTGLLFTVAKSKLMPEAPGQPSPEAQRQRSPELPVLPPPSASTSPTVVGRKTKVPRKRDKKGRFKATKSKES